MNYRRFGRTGLQVSELVFGAGFVGGLLIHQDDDTKRTALQRALDGGINWIDTAASYGQGKSEQALGWLLKELKQQPYLSTKFAVDPGRGDFLGQIKGSLEDSLKRLQRDSVDLLQLHNSLEPQAGGRGITPAMVLGENGIADALDKLREQGYFNYIGITALGDAASCRQVIESGRFDSAQVYYNLLNPSAGRALPDGWHGHDFSGIIAACKANDMAIMNIRVFAAGILVTEQRHGREIIITRDTDVAGEERKARTVFNKLGERYGSRAQTAIRFALANPDISCVVIGLAELSHLDEALAGAGQGPLPATALAELEPLYSNDFAG